MRDLIDLQKKLYPDLLDVMQRRYSILQSVELFQPIGRRALAENTSLTERTIRGEVDFLHKQNLISVTSKGMYISKEGKLILDQLAGFMREIMGLNVLEQQIKEKLPIKDVIIVPGNSDEYSWIKQEMGKACVNILKNIVSENCTIAVTGGTTMAAIAEVMTPFATENNCLFVPARGGLGEKVENQSNTIAASMANKSNGQYRLLYAPDLLSESSYQNLVNEPTIKEVLHLINGADVVIHGIGDALTMAKRRGTPENTLTKLSGNSAVSEAFGYYFDAKGSVVHKVRTVGLQLTDLDKIKYVITVAGGKSKAKAIASYFKTGKSDLLITDEAAAQQILRDS